MFDKDEMFKKEKRTLFKDKIKITKFVGGFDERKSEKGVGDIDICSRSSISIIQF